MKFSAQTGNRIEIVTSDGAVFHCYIDDQEESDRIVCSELDAEWLDALFDELEEERSNAEIKVLEFVNGMKYTVDKDERKEDAA